MNDRFHRRLASALRRAHDEDGSALTEFVIGLPVWITLFIGILNLAQLNQGGVIVKAQAHSDMWNEAIRIQTTWMPDWSNHPVAAAGEAAVFHSQTGGSALDYALDGSGLIAATGVSGGILSESYVRVKPADLVENIGPADGKVTWDLKEVMSTDDDVAYDLMNDGVEWGAFSSGGDGNSGVLGGLNSVISFGGMRPAIAAGIRYGISGGQKEYTVNMMGLPDQTLQARSHVANAPKATSKYLTFAVVRLAMERDDAYDTAIDFKWIPELEGFGDSDAVEQEITDWANCEQGNQDAEANGGETQDCGDPPEMPEGDLDSKKQEFCQVLGGCDDSPLGGM